MRKWSPFKKFISIDKDNKGSVMITVLVAFLFVSVLAAIILSTVSVNFQMRAIDRSTKDEFYYAEKTLNDLYNGIGQECSAIMGKSYNDVLSEYKTTDEGSYKDEEEAYKAFSKSFVTAFYKEIAKKQSTKFPGYIVKDTHKKGSSDASSRAIVKSYGEIKYYTNSSRDTELTISSESDVNIEKVGLIVIRGVKIQSNPEANENIGYISEINTDIVVEVPKVSFFTTNNRVFDYAILANEGLELEPNSQVTVKGNVYGGTTSFKTISDYASTYNKTSDYGGIFLDNNSSLKIDDAAYVVSGGDISLDNATLNINQDNTMLNNQIWFENLEINGNSTVNIKGDLFAADDLQINADADGTKVKIEGSYYGYNDGKREMTGTGGGSDTTTLTTKKAIITSLTDYERSTPQGDNIASRSSSIVLNAKEADLDMSDLKTLLLFGNAFINHESKKSIEPGSMIKDNRRNDTPAKSEYLDLIIDSGKISDASVPESVALKMSQDIILMPTEFLKDANPRICESGASDPFSSDGISIPNGWFGKAYIDSTKPYTYVKLDADGSAMIYAYCYLNFKDDASKAEYVKAIIDGANTGTEPTAATLKKELLDRTSSYDGKLKVQIGNPNTRLYASGAVLTYDGSNLSYIDPSTFTASNAFTSYSANLYKRYRMLDTYLDNMSDVPLSSTDTKSINYYDFQRNDNEMPTGRIFWLWGLRKAGKGQATGSPIQAIKYEVSGSSEADSMEAERNEFGSNFIFLRTISGSFDLCSELVGSNPHKAFIIIDGDATVNSDLTIQGFLVCKGKLTVKDGKKLTVIYDSTLLNKRIEKEQQKLIENEGFHDENAPNSNPEVRNLLIYYLMSGSRSLYGNGSEYKMPKQVDNISNSDMKNNPTYREYRYIDGVTASTAQDLNTEYTNFVYYENWKKGQR
ncbi:MAG: hypothetical protein Q4E51_03605 [Lachnospiraceae bacterium]|nr:hypothetical protein [Lachnospiraceae bacterium]